MSSSANMSSMGLPGLKRLDIETVLCSLGGFDATWDHAAKRQWLKAHAQQARTRVLHTPGLGPKTWLAYLEYLALEEAVTLVDKS